MYRDKRFRVRPLGETLADLEAARVAHASALEKVFVADGDALIMDVPHWEAILAAWRAHAAGIELSVIFLLGAGGTERSHEHAQASARLASAMDPAFLSLLTLTVVPGTPIARLEATGRFELPSVRRMLEELREFVALARPTDAVLRTNHASNYLALGGNLPRDRESILAAVDRALGAASHCAPNGRAACDGHDRSFATRPQRQTTQTGRPTMST